MTTPTSLPKVTIAVPLYRSAQFLPIVTDTLRKFDYSNLEFLISDRHYLDDTIDRLRDSFAADSRFRFLAARDELDWVAHYNLLLREASGDYFVWVSHDDSYSADFVTKLVEALEAQTDAVLAYACAQRIGLTGEPTPHLAPKIPAKSIAPGPLTAYRVALSGGLQFHGLFRRQWLIDRELWIRPTVQNIAADMIWIFTVAMLGRTVYVENCTFLKRYYPASAHKAWGAIMRAQHVWNFARVARSYADDYLSSRLQRLLAISVIYAACSFWALKFWLRNSKFTELGRDTAPSR